MEGSLWLIHHLNGCLEPYGRLLGELVLMLGGGEHDRRVVDTKGDQMGIKWMMAVN